MKDIEVLNAKVKDVVFRIEDCGLMVTLTLEGDGWGVCYSSGTLVYTEYNRETEKEDIIVPSQATQIISKIYELLNFFNVNALEAIKGKYVRVEINNNSWSSVVKLIDILNGRKTFKWGE